jgi:biopolymer transport protein ExbD
MSPFGRFDVILLALMLVYLFAVVIYVSGRYYFARRAPGIESFGKATLAANLNIELGGLKSIAITAPYLGLAGTCEGILSVFGGIGMAKQAALALIVARSALALVPTAAAIPVAVLATFSYNFLCARVDLLEAEAFQERQQTGRHFRGAVRFPPTQQFSHLPAFGLLAVFALAFGITGFMTLPSFHPPKGFYVELAAVRCEHDAVDRLIVLHVSDAGKLFLNLEPEERNRLAARLSAIYGMRENRTLYLVADAAVPFQNVADALDTVKNVPSKTEGQVAGMRNNNLDIKVRLVTPKVFDEDCVAASSGHGVLR